MHSVSAMVRELHCKSSGSGLKSKSCLCLWDFIPLADRAASVVVLVALDPIYLLPEFECQRGHIGSVFHL